MAGIFRGMGARTQRRGSLGFSDGGGCGTPPARVDSGDDLEGLVCGYGIGKDMEKIKNMGGSMMSTTPGGDGEMGLSFWHRRKRESECEGLVARELPMVQEDITLNILKKTETVTANSDPLRGVDKRLNGLMVTNEELEESKGDGGSIFLIDLEEKEGQNGKIHIKPKSKKFSASSLLNSAANSWFFKRDDDDDELDSLVMDKEEDESVSGRKTSNMSATSTETDEEEVGRSNVLKKLKASLSKSGWREMNFGAPQGT